MIQFVHYMKTILYTQIFLYNIYFNFVIFLIGPRGIFVSLFYRCAVFAAKKENVCFWKSSTDCDTVLKQVLFVFQISSTPPRFFISFFSSHFYFFLSVLLSYVLFFYDWFFIHFYLAPFVYISFFYPIISPGRNTIGYLGFPGSRILKCEINRRLGLAGSVPRHRLVLSRVSCLWTEFKNGF